MHSPPAIKKILIYRIGSLGDTIVALPCFHLIERLYPNAERVLLTEQVTLPEAGEPFAAWERNPTRTPY